MNKSRGITSYAAMRQVKRLFAAKKAGHTGSLDPLATGLLPICLGEATKFSRFLLTAQKQYRVVAGLGRCTTTGDAEGVVIRERPVPPLTVNVIEQILSRFEGEMSQIPPMYSALKVGGQPLYRLARRGLVVDRAPRLVQIERLRLLRYTAASLECEAIVSKGTYIRTLVEDIGEALGCGATVVELERLGVGPYTAAQWQSFESLEQCAVSGGYSALATCLLPVASVVVGLPTVQVSATEATRLWQGQSLVSVCALPPGSWVKLLHGPDRLVGVGEVLAENIIVPRRLAQPFRL